MMTERGSAREACSKVHESGNLHEISSTFIPKIKEDILVQDMDGMIHLCL